MANGPRASVPILTYHSISEEPGPTSIARAVFDSQMAAVAELGVRVVGLDWAVKWLRNEATLSERTIIITFDDAFEDFVEGAHPILRRYGFPACVFAPTAIIGGVENWYGANAAPRRLMRWEDVRALSSEGVAFGSHTRTHPDLTRLDDAALEHELSGSRRELEDKLGKQVDHFAPPYGRSNPAVRRAIARHYALSVGVALGEATKASPVFDLPRIEMHYYRDIKRWRSFLRGEGGLYFQTRRIARGLREAATQLARQAAH